MWYTPYLFQPQGSYSFGRTPSLGCQASGPLVPSDGCEMLARAREREREREYPLMMSWERWPPHAIHRLPQKLPQVPTLDSSASGPADHDQPTHSVQWLTSTGCFNFVGDVRLRPNFPNGSLAMTGGRSRLRLVRLTLPNLPNHPDNPGWPQIPCSY